MRDTKDFIKAYHDFRGSVDFDKSGIKPDVDSVVWSLLMGIPHVPADKDQVEDAQMAAIDQRVSILKAVFVEVNRDQVDEFINDGLKLYDLAGRTAKSLLQEDESTPDKVAI